MLVCPRCGDKYQESDLRTMCPRCLVALEKRESVEAEPAAAMPETTMPQAPLPEVAMPEVEAAPPVGAPEAAPPVGAPDAAQPAPLAVHIPREEPAPTPSQPRAEEAAREQAPPRESAARGRARPAEPTVHPHEEYSDLSTAGWAILAGVLTVLALRSTLGLLHEGGGFFALVWTAGLWFVVVLATRMWLYRYYVRAVQIVLPASVGLGSEIAYRLVLTPARRLPVDRATLLLRAEERVERESGGGSLSSNLLRAERFRTEIQISRDVVLAGNQEATFAGTFRLPEEAPPTFVGQHNSVLWTARVWVGMPGWRPDVRKRVELTVLPVVPPKPEEQAPREPSEVPLPALQACGARLTLTAPVDAYGSLHLRAGESVEGRLLMRPTEEVKCRRVLLELRYTVSSRGQDEGRTIETETLWEGDLAAGREIEAPVHLKIPASGPITYQGQYFAIAWAARIRVDIPMWTDLVASIPLIVERAAAEAASA